MANNDPFYRFWSRPTKDEHLLLADAHDWFQRFFPGSHPQFVKEENFNTLRATLRMPFSMAVAGGELQPVGNIQFLAQVHLKDGFIGLRFSEFHHVGGAEMQAVGSLKRPHPGDHPYFNKDSWLRLKQQVATRLQSYFDTFAG